MEAHLTASVSEHMLDLAELRPGMHVLDLATGSGEPALRAAHRVGMTGRVVGVDSSTEMLALARERADRAGLTNIRLIASDAETFAEPVSKVDAVTCRWGLMYMQSPERVLVRARTMLVPTGALVVAVWTEESEWATLPRAVLASVAKTEPLPLSALRYGEVGLLERDLTATRFVVDRSDRMRVPVVKSADADEIVRWASTVTLRKAVARLTSDEEAAWRHALRRELEGLRDTDGLISLGGVTRIVRCYAGR
jgi:precorrin-6B methylase 2